MEIAIQENSQYGLVVSSRAVAKELGKRHDHVIRDLKQILENPNVGSLNSENSNLSSLIIPSAYRTNGQKRTYKEYLLTKDGFTLYMFNIQGYQDFKMVYIQKFNEMEKALYSGKQLSLSSDSYLSVNKIEFQREKNFNDKYWDCIQENMEEAYKIECKIEKIYKKELQPLYDNIIQLIKAKKTMLSAFNFMKYGNDTGRA